MFYLIKKRNSEGYFIREVKPEEAESFKIIYSGNIVDEEPSDIEALRERAEVLLSFSPLEGPIEIQVIED